MCGKKNVLKINILAYVVLYYGFFKFIRFLKPKKESYHTNYKTI